MLSVLSFQNRSEDQQSASKDRQTHVFINVLAPNFFHKKLGKWKIVLECSYVHSGWFDFYENLGKYRKMIEDFECGTLFCLSLMGMCHLPVESADYL